MLTPTSVTAVSSIALDQAAQTNYSQIQQR